MASLRSDFVDVIASLRESTRRGDWKTAGELAKTMRQLTLPAGHVAQGEYLQLLKEALIAAKVSRARLATSLVRLNAVARFNNARQEFGVPADF